MAACDCLSFCAQIFGQLSLQHRRGFEWHQIKTFVKLRQKPNSVTLHYSRGFDPQLVILETLGRGKPRHADIDTGLRRVARWVLLQNFRIVRGLWVQQHDIYVMMKASLCLGSNSTKGSTAHRPNVCQFLPKIAIGPARAPNRWA